MNTETFIENFSALFPQSNPADFSETTEFKKLPEWNSLVALSVIAMVEDEYDVLLKSADIVGATTIRDLFNKVSEQQS